MLIECKECEAVVDAELLSSFDENIEENEFLDLVNRYSFLKCPRCKNPILVHQVKLDYDEFEHPYRLYPSQDKQVNPLFPKPIKNAYQEALSCYKVKAFTAATIMCRKTLEGICDVRGISSGNLKPRLKKMKDKGIIEARLFEWAEELRISGNEAAHDVNITISKYDAKDIIEFTDALLEYIFTFNDKFNEFKKRRESDRKH